MEVLIRIDSGLLIIIPGALIFHLCLNNTLLTLLKFHLRPLRFGFYQKLSSSSINSISESRCADLTTKSADIIEFFSSRKYDMDFNIFITSFLDAYHIPGHKKTTYVAWKIFGQKKKLKGYFSPRFQSSCSTIQII